MNKFPKKILLILALLFIFTSCAGTLVSLKFEGKKIVNSRLGLSYSAAPYNYQPVSVGDAYAHLKGSDTTLYSIMGADETEWLTTKYTGRTTTVFYSEKYSLPSLTELEPDQIYICTNGDKTFSIGTIEHKGVIDSLIDIIVNGEQVEWPYLSAIKSYDLKFHSDDNFPFLFYNLTYAEFEEGKFIYNYVTNECVMIGDILSDYIK